MPVFGIPDSIMAACVYFAFVESINDTIVEPSTQFIDDILKNKTALIEAFEALLHIFDQFAAGCDLEELSELPRTFTGVGQFPVGANGNDLLDLEFSNLF